MLFDLDGVLWDTSSIHAAAFAEVCRQEGLEPVDYERLGGRPTAEAWSLIFEENGRSLGGEELRRVTRAKQHVARRRLIADPPLHPEVPLVASLAGSGVLLGLVTGSSSETTDVFLSAAGIAFDAVVTAESVCRGKPAPDAYQAAAAALGIQPWHCWVLEDSLQGLESASDARTRVVHLAAVGSCPALHPPVEACVPGIAAFLRLTGVVEA